MNIESAHNNESLGQFLRRARTEQGLSFEEAVESTKISPNNLRALEEDDYANLPADAFVNGFYGIYARYLSLDPDDIRNRYNKQKKLLPKKTGKHSPTPGQLAMRTSSMAEPPSVASNSFIGLSLLALIVIGIAACWYFSWNPATYLSKKLRGVTELTPATEQDTAMPVSSNTHTALPASPDSTGARPASPTVTDQAEVIDTTADGEPAPTGTATAVVPVPNTYILKATFKEPTKLTVKVDDKPIEYLSFEAGAAQIWNADRSIILSLPAGTGVSLTLNDLPLTLPKKQTGEELTISIPEYLLE